MSDFITIRFLLTRAGSEMTLEVKGVGDLELK